MPRVHRWSPGDVVVRREVLNDGRCWFELPVIVVADDGELLASYIATGTPFRFPPGRWPTADGRHPWAGQTHWSGNGVLMLQRPGESHAVWVFWHGPEREFRGWYVNIQEPFTRTANGYNTQDLELDLLIATDGTVEWKDLELVDQRVREGRFSREQARAIRAEGERVAREVDAGRFWWEPSWAKWDPDPAWTRAM